MARELDEAEVEQILRDRVTFENVWHSGRPCIRYSIRGCPHSPYVSASQDRAKLEETLKSTIERFATPCWQCGQGRKAK
jgi:hypothetical protein